MTAFPFIEKEYGIRAVWRPLGQGHIHETYRSEDGLYVLQHINTFVFCDVQGLMENISRFTAFMRKKLKEAGLDPYRGTLTVVKTKNGRLYADEADGSAWRIFENIRDTFSVEYGEQTNEILRECGRIFGQFQLMAADYPIETLCETIPHFMTRKSASKTCEGLLRPMPQAAHQPFETKLRGHSKRRIRLRESSWIRWQKALCRLR